MEAAASAPDAAEVRDTGAERERSRSPSRNATPGQLTGTAKRWNDDKGFGFIKPDDGSEDIFCHRTSIMDGDCLVEGARLAYTKGWDDRKNKERAENVTGGAQRSAGAGAGPPPPGYGGSYGAPPGYGAPPPGYGAPPPGYGAPPPAYGAPPPGYGAPPPDYHGYGAGGAYGAGTGGGGGAGRTGGTVKRWNEESGFGFIKPDDGSEDLFVHRTSIEGAEARASRSPNPSPNPNPSTSPSPSPSPRPRPNPKGAARRRSGHVREAVGPSQEQVEGGEMPDRRR